MYSLVTTGLQSVKLGCGKRHDYCLQRCTIQLHAAHCCLHPLQDILIVKYHHEIEILLYWLTGKTCLTLPANLALVLHCILGENDGVLTDLMESWVMQEQQSSAEDIEQQGHKANRSSSMQVLLVRTVEKVLDGACGRLKATAWNTVLDQSEAYKVLQVSTFSTHQASCCQAGLHCMLSRLAIAVHSLS